MDRITDDAELLRRLRLYAFTRAPAEIAEQLQAIPGTPADILTTAPEILYAWRDKLDAEGLTLTGQLFQLWIDHYYTTLNRGDRSARIVAGVRRDLGETGPGVATTPAAEDPEPEVNRRGGVDWRAPAAAVDA